MRYTAYFKCFCGAEWHLEGKCLKELVNRVSAEGCPKQCTYKIIYMIRHEDEEKLLLKQYKDHGLYAFERF